MPMSNHSLQAELNQLSIVLAAKVEYGQYTRNDALAVARAILYETSKELLGMQPAQAPG